MVRVLGVVVAICLIGAILSAGSDSDAKSVKRYATLTMRVVKEYQPSHDGQLPSLRDLNDPKSWPRGKMPVNKKTEKPITVTDGRFSDGDVGFVVEGSRWWTEGYWITKRQVPKTVTVSP